MGVCLLLFTAKEMIEAGIFDVVSWVISFSTEAGLNGSCVGHTPCDSSPVLDAGSELKLFNCGNKMFGNLFLDATGRSTKDKFCMAYDDRLGTDSNTSYTISVDLFNYQSISGPGTGHLGLAYNFFDTDNYEGLYLRIHTSSPCIQLFEVKKGKINYHGDNSCIGHPKTRTWFNLKISVDHNVMLAKVYIDGILQSTGTLALKLPPMPRGAIVVHNGYKNMVFYRNFKIIQT